MSRRTAERHARRIEVRFWRRGDAQAHSAYTVDLSKTGLFLGTPMALEPGERLRLEIVDKDKGFIVEGQVARVHRVALALRHVEQPGCGVRFLGPGELVGNLLNGAGGKSAPQVRRPSGFPSPPPETKTAAQPKPAPKPEPPAAPSSPPEAAAPAARPSPEPVRPARARPAPGSLEDLFGPDPEPADEPPAPAAAESRPDPAPEPVEAAVPAKPGAEAPAAAAPQQAATPATAPIVPVEFADRDGFLSVYGRDIAAGGLFVTTEAPAGLHEIVLIELRPPVGADKQFRFEARVVHRFDPQSGGAKPGLTGMGVQFLDPDRVREALAPIVAQLGG